MEYDANFLYSTSYTPKITKSIAWPDVLWIDFSDKTREAPKLRWLFQHDHMGGQVLFVSRNFYMP